MNTQVKITDSPADAADCAKKGIPYIAVLKLDEKNKRQTFPNGAYCVENEADIDEVYKERVYRRFKGLPWDIAETERLKIREITLSDVPRLYELYGGEGITKYMEPLFDDMEQELAYTKNYIENVYKFYGYGMWVIELKESGEVIGRVGLEYKEGEEGLELGFMIGEDYQHKGYAYEACKAVIAYGQAELGASRFYALASADNEASIKLCGRLGFRLSRYEENEQPRLQMRMLSSPSDDFVYKSTEKELLRYVYEA